jgi:hypothetical protein
VARYEMTEGDTAPLEVQLETEDGVPPLNGATVRFVSVPVQGTAGPSIDTAGYVVDENAVEGDPDFGWVGWQPLPGDVVPGISHAKFQVTFGGTALRSFPSEPIELVVRPLP